MNAKWFLVGVALLAFSFSAWASCANPTIAISVNTDRWSIGNTLDVNLTFSADPAPSQMCICLQNGNCGMEWQTDHNGSWNQIPQTTNPNIDLNCSGASCWTGRGVPTEDLTQTRSISCIDQNSFHIRGYQKHTDTSSDIVKVYCYPSPGCTPPASGNFDVDETCTFIAVPVLVDGNYNIGSNGYVSHNDSDVNFFSSGSKFINIQDGGQMDLNQSMLFAGFTFEQGLLGGLLGFFGIALFGLYSLFSRKEAMA